MAYGDRRYLDKGKKPAHVSVTPKKNENPERLIKRFIRKVKKEGVLEEVRDRRYYETPSTKRRKERQRRDRVIRKLEQKRQTER